MTDIATATLQFPTYRHNDTGVLIEATIIKSDEQLLQIRASEWHEGQLRILTYPTAPPQGWVGPEGDNFTAFSGKPVAIGNALVKGPAGDLEVWTSSDFEKTFTILIAIASLIETAAILAGLAADEEDLSDFSVFVLAETLALALERLDTLTNALTGLGIVVQRRLAHGDEALTFLQLNDAALTTTIRPLSTRSFDRLRGRNVHFFLTSTLDPQLTTDKLAELLPSFATTGGVILRTEF